jgi:hypothetical protein
MNKAHAARASPPPDPLGTQLRLPTPRSLSDTRPLLLSLMLEQPRLTLSASSSPSPTRVIQASRGDEVVFVPPGVSRTLVPLDCALVLQILYCVVVALTVRSDTGAFCRFQKG